MTSFPGGFWLENGRIEVQSVWFALFGSALFLSIVALHQPRRAAIARAARVFWTLSIGLFFAMWIAGATLEMMRRAAPLSGAHLVMALGAFSLLLAGTFSLVREGFGATWKAPLRAPKMALALLILTFAGWFFGGLALEWNALWNLAPQGFSDATSRAPDAWNLSFGGAALWGASALVQSRDETTLRVKNPRAAMWYLLGIALLLSLPFGARTPLAANVFCLGAGVFSFKIWRLRADCPRFLHSNWRLRGPILLVIAASPFFVGFPFTIGKFPFTVVEFPSFFVARHNLEFQLALLGEAWRVPQHLLAFAGLSVAIFWLISRARLPLRTAIQGKAPQRALLCGALSGFVLSTLFFGPAGAVFWAFWPLAGVFFDVLSPRESAS